MDLVIRIFKQNKISLLLYASKGLRCGSQALSHAKSIQHSQHPALGDEAQGTPERTEYVQKYGMNIAVD